MGYYERFKDAPWYEQSANEYITIIGAGGIGSNTAFNLIRTLKSKIEILDFDMVEEHNIGTQFYLTNQINSSKVSSLKYTMGLFDPTSYSRVRYIQAKLSDYNGVYPITICAVDNMDARKEAFELWKNLENRELFIDGRLTANIYQVFTVTPDKEELYAKSLFPNSMIEDGPCTFKQTSYFASMIGARITQMVVNYLINKYAENTICNLPFAIMESSELVLFKTASSYDNL
ncbi:MAG TPA: ThiF family adenylyltransferase [Candidatus Dojkabacteria bacterium]|nr:ThiF family adenylyltransferase [Candidatus Dojkabacteria bacterium]